MFRITNLWQLALITSVIATAIIFLLLFLVGAIEVNSVFLLLLVMMFTMLTLFLSVLYLVRIFVFRRVKPIYKIIKRAKSKEINSNIMRDDILNKVEDDVRNWMMDTTTEMETMQSLERYRKDYIGNISHELKTPIFNIQGYIHSLLDGAMHEEKYLKSFLQKAATNVDRLNTIVQDLELISKIESGTVSLVIDKFSLNKLVQEVIDHTKDIAQTKNIEVYVKDGVNKSFKVKADKNAIRQVLTNLVTNSVKYGRRDGTTRIGFYDMDKYVLVEITDDGVGIEEAHLPHVFDRFYRVEKSRVRGEGGVAGGSGLGLSIVKHLVEAHDQTVSVRSTVNLGSTFGFTLAKA